MDPKATGTVKQEMRLQDRINFLKEKQKAYVCRVFSDEQTEVNLMLHPL